jgi:hypothetical protein
MSLGGGRTALKGCGRARAVELFDHKEFLYAYAQRKAFRLPVLDGWWVCTMRARAANAVCELESVSNPEPVRLLAASIHGRHRLF